MNFTGLYAFVGDMLKQSWGILAIRRKILRHVAPHYQKSPTLVSPELKWVICMSTMPKAYMMSPTDLRCITNAAGSPSFINWLASGTCEHCVRLLFHFYPIFKTWLCKVSEHTVCCAWRGSQAKVFCSWAVEGFTRRCPELADKQHTSGRKMSYRSGFTSCFVKIVLNFATLRASIFALISSDLMSEELYIPVASSKVTFPPCRVCWRLYSQLHIDLIWQRTCNMIYKSNR